METNQTIFTVCGVVIFLLLPTLAILFYWLCKVHVRRGAVLVEIHDGDFLLPGESALSSGDAVPPSQYDSLLFILEDAKLEPRDIPVVGLEDCTLVPEGILNVEPGVLEHNWHGSVIVVDPAGDPSSRHVAVVVCTVPLVSSIPKLIRIRQSVLL